MGESISPIALEWDAYGQRCLSWTPSRAFQETMKRAVLDFISNRTKSILEVGCGHGTWLDFILHNASNPTDLQHFQQRCKRIEDE